MSRARVDVVKFIERACRTEYERRVQLEWWQVAFVLLPAFNTFKIAEQANDVRGIEVGDLLRRFNQVLNGIPKKNGKSDLAAYLSHFALLADDPYPEVYGMAGDKKQAAIVLERAKNMMRRSEELKAELGPFRDKIIRKDDKGFYEVISSDSETAHGMNPSFKIWDELWQYRDYTLVEAVSDSPSRREPIELIITYAGIQAEEGIPLWDLYNRAHESPNRILLMDEEGHWTPEALARIEQALRARLDLEKYLEKSPVMTGKQGPDYPGWDEGDVVWCCDLGTSYAFWSEVNLARWVDQAYLDSQADKMPKGLYRRLHKNKWPSGDAGFVTEAQVEACEVLWKKLIPTSRDFTR